MSSISSVSGQVAVAVGFLTRDPSLIWNTEFIDSHELHVNTSNSIQNIYIYMYCMPNALPTLIVLLHVYMFVSMLLQ